MKEWEYWFVLFQFLKGGITGQKQHQQHTTNLWPSLDSIFRLSKPLGGFCEFKGDKRYHLSCSKEHFPRPLEHLSNVLVGNIVYMGIPTTEAIACYWVVEHWNRFISTDFVDYLLWRLNMFYHGPGLPRPSITFRDSYQFPVIMHYYSYTWTSEEQVHILFNVQPITVGRYYNDAC